MSVKITDAHIERQAKALFERAEERKSSLSYRWAWDDFAERSDTKMFWRGEAKFALEAALQALDEEQKPEPGLREDEVEWVVNDIAELGVKIRDQFFFCYKGESLVYKDAKHDDDTQMMWRYVLKREFGEVIHPINYGDPTRVGTVSVDDGCEWKPVPPALASIQDNDDA